MDYIQEIIDRDADPRVKNWYLMSSPFRTILICLSYVLLVKTVLPAFMKNRKPYILTNIIHYYNIFQVALSAYAFYVLSYYGWMRYNSLFCELIDQENTALLDATWWYYFAKFSEFFDTIFFVLRKKYNQVSALHVFHHSVMPIVAWIGLKYSPGGPHAMFAAINSFVHIIMYSYYLFAAMGPQYQKYLWWKKYLTILQLVQFVIIITHCLLLVFSDCKVIKLSSYVLLAVVVIVMAGFLKFYKETYSKEPKIQEMKVDNEKPGPSSSFTSLRSEYKKSKLR